MLELTVKIRYRMSSLQTKWPKREIAYTKLPGHPRGLTPKKEHELVNFAAFIVEECALRGICHVVDVGSGVGHLAQCLARAAAGIQRVTAIEGNVAYHSKASGARRISCDI
jgi:hypothetical protein